MHPLCSTTTYSSAHWCITRKDWCLMPLPVGSVVRVSYNGVCLGQRIRFVTDWKIRSSNSIQNSQQDTRDIAELFGTPLNIFQPAYLACLPQNYMLEDVTAQAVHPVRYAHGQYLSNTPGAIATDATASNVAATFVRYGELAGRNKISVSHIGPVPPGQYTGGYTTVPYNLLLATCAGTFKTPTSTLAPTIVLDPVVLHRDPNANPATNLLEYYRIGFTLRTMRRRTVGVGE